MTKHTKVKKFKFFWADQVAEQEQWLSDMARQGLHLKSVNPLCIWTFVRDEPADIVYRVDFNYEKADYIQLLEDVGWTRAASLFGWQYWRTSAGNGRSPELFTDASSKNAKFLRVTVQVLLGFLPAAIMSTSPSARQAMSELSWPFMIFLVTLYGVGLVGLLRLLVRLATMRSDPS